MSWPRGRSQSRSDFVAASGWWPQGAHASSWPPPKAPRKPRRESSGHGGYGGGTYDSWRGNADGRGGFGQPKTPRSQQYTFDDRWRPGWVDYGGHARREPNEVYTAYVKACRLTSHREDVRDAARARLQELTAKAAKAVAERDAEQANFEARETSAAAAKESEQEWCEKLNAQRAEQEAAAADKENDEYSMWVDDAAPAATQGLSAELWDRYKSSDNPVVQELLAVIKAGQQRHSWAATQPFRAGASTAPSPTQPDSTADCDGMLAYGAALAAAACLDDKDARLAAEQAAHSKHRQLTAPAAVKGAGKALVAAQPDSPYAGKGS